MTTPEPTPEERGKKFVQENKAWTAEQRLKHPLCCGHEGCTTTATHVVNYWSQYKDVGYYTTDLRCDDHLTEFVDNLRDQRGVKWGVASIGARMTGIELVAVAKRVG